MSQPKNSELPHEFAATKRVDCQPANKGPTTSATYDSVHVRRWQSQPGFIDPFEVVYTCIQVMRRATYVNVKYSRKIHHGSDDAPPDKGKLSPGLALYFCPLLPDPEITTAVKNYIEAPSQDALRRISRSNDTMQALLFLLTYLRLRGPLVKFRYKTLSHLQEMRSTQRWLSRAFLNTICEHQLEFEAAVQIGHYLNYVVTIGFAHDLFWIKELLADLFGPVVIDFVHIGSNPEDALTEQQLVQRRSDAMLRLIDGTPWDSLRRQQNFNLVLNSDPDGDVYRRRSQFDFEVNRKLTVRPLNEQLMVNQPMQIIHYLNNQINTDPVGDTEQ